MRTYYCPANGRDCFCWNKDGTCKMGEMNLNPFYECDDFAAFWDADDEYWVDDNWEDESLENEDWEDEEDVF